MSKQIEAMKQALKRIAEWSEHPLEMAVDYGSNGVRDYYRQIATDALEQAEQERSSVKQSAEERSSVERVEPVAWVCYGAPGKRDIDFEEADINKLPIGTLLYTTPPGGRQSEELRSEEDCLTAAPVQEQGLTWERFNALEAEIATLQTEWQASLKKIERLKAAPVQNLQCFHCQDTIETLNDKVMHLMAQRPVAKPHKWVHATEWRGLTDEEIGDALSVWELTEEWPTFAYAARAIEAKLREKNSL